MARDAGNLYIKPHRTPNSSSDTHRSSGGGGGSIARFPEGSLVEVRTDEVDFRGVYFSATVISSPPDSPKKGGIEESEILYVEYHDLLAREDGSDRLREYVKLSHVRPVPPLQEVVKGFEQDDVVDAFYKDGWWQGVVSRVLESGKRFVVTFQNPPDVLEFGIADLRAHWDWDWVSGSWVRPQKQSIAGLMFDVGRKVEVSFHRDDSQDAWFPATIREDLGNRVLLVEHTGDKGQVVQARFDPLHVRPCPPLLKDKNFVLLEKVDAFFDFGWWSGVITKELENYRYIVYFKQMKQEKEFNQSELRPHMEWKDGKWFTSSQETSTRLDDGVHGHDTPGNSCASETTASTTAIENAVDVNGSRDGKTSSSLTSMKGSFIPDNQKMSHATPTRRQHSELGNTLSQPPKKRKRGSVVEEKQEDKQDQPLPEALCGFLSPDSTDNIETSASQTVEDQPSLKSSWGEKSTKQRNVRAKHNVGGVIKSTSSSMKKSSTQMTSEMVGHDAGGEKPNTARKNTEEDAQNKRTLAVVIGLPCAERGSPEFRVSGKRSHRSNGKEIVTVVNDQEQQHEKSLIQEIKVIHYDDKSDSLSPEFRVSGKRSHRLNGKEIVTVVNDQEQQHEKSLIQEIKNSTQVEVGIFSEKRKRGRPKKISVESIQTPVSGNAQNGGVASHDLEEEDDGLQIIPQVEVVGMEASTPHQEVANDQSNLKNKRVRVMKRTMPLVLQEKGAEESVEQGDNRSSKRGRKRILSEKIAAQSEDPLGASGGKMMDLNRIVDTARVSGEVSSNEFDNEPLSKWIVEIHSPSIIDGSRPPPDGNLEQSVSNAKKQQDGIVIHEGSEMQVENETQDSPLVDKDSVVTSEPQSLPTEDNAVSAVLGSGGEKQPEKRKQGSPLADKNSILPNEQPESVMQTSGSTLAVRREPQRLPFVENTSLWKTIESTMEIFQRIPQKPHFEPLQHVKGSSSREGLAIGYMVAFASLVERTSRLQLNDPTSVVDDIMGTVAELERHGFDVSFVQDQVTKFLEAKDKEEKLVDEVNNLNSQLSIHRHEKTKIDEEIREMQEVIRKLQEKISVAELVKGKEDEEITSLQVRLKDTEEGIENLRRSFKVDSVILR